MSQPDVRKGMPPRRLERGTFEQRFKSAFVDPMFAPLQRELQAIADAAWDAYDDSRKAPITRKAGAGFADPDYEIAIDWLTTRAAIDDAPPSSRRPRGTFAHPRRQRLVAHRAHLSRRHLPCFPPETA
jgi:hypothetical protein